MHISGVPFIFIIITKTVVSDAKIKDVDKFTFQKFKIKCHVSSLQRDLDSANFSERRQSATNACH